MDIDSRPMMDTNRVRRRGRPRGFETDRLVDAAMDLFWVRGYRPTTTRELESAMGVKQSSIYNAFGSKDGLLAATLDRYETLADQVLLQPLETSTEGLRAVHDFFTTLAQWITDAGRCGCLLTNMMAEDAGANAAITQRTRRYRERVRTALLGALQRAAEAGEIAVESLEARASLLLAAVLGLSMVVRARGSQQEFEGVLNGVQTQIRMWRQA
ncbi:MAG: TetR/AcrR family transcriptional regulator [Gammaproteobacteria bacterium]|nr:TetR/AcrR family transcriptional regulator [Gammaproteobacteria bacterium]